MRLSHSFARQLFQVFAGIGLLFAHSLNASAAPSTAFVVKGHTNGGYQTTFDLAGLEAYAAANPTAVRSVDVPKTGGGTDTYTGISLYSLLSSYIPVNPTVKNDILRDYVMAIGSDGYQVAFSLGELSPSFGNQNDIVAYQLNGVDLTNSGFARIVAPADVKAGRWVSNLTELNIGYIPYEGAGPGGVSSSLTVEGNVLNPQTYNYSDLPAGLPTSTVTVTSQGGSLPGTTFTGVSLNSLINQSVIDLNANIKNDILRQVVVATATDGYSVVFSGGELNPNFGNQPDLLAYQNAAGVPLGNDGFARTVVPNDVRGGRYVSNLTSLEVLDATVPEPDTAWLFLLGAAGLWWSSARRTGVIRRAQ